MLHDQLVRSGKSFDPVIKKTVGHARFVHVIIFIVRTSFCSCYLFWDLDSFVPMTDFAVATIFVAETDFIPTMEFVPATNFEVVTYIVPSTIFGVVGKFTVFPHLFEPDQFRVTIYGNFLFLLILVSFSCFYFCKKRENIQGNNAILLQSFQYYFEPNHREGRMVEVPTGMLVVYDLFFMSNF